MQFKDLKNLLSEYDKVRVQIYCDYIKKLQEEKFTTGNRKGHLKNTWMQNFDSSKAASLFKKVAIDNIYIDGDSITLQCVSGVVQPNYNYQAYKNKLLNIYPNSTFDLQLVYDADEITITKEDGKIRYSHKMNNLFGKKREIIGAYCIIKNKKGEFIETIDKEEISKIRSTAKTDNIWKVWFSEMVLKSVLKRACKRHFKDIVINMFNIDNENSDVSEDLLSHEIKKEIKDCCNLIELKKVYNKYNEAYSKNLTFKRLFSEKKVEIQESEDFKEPVGEKGLQRAIESIKSGVLTKEDFLNKYILDETQFKELEKQLKDARV